jgi:sugar lactone lactonase YvrE
MTSLKPTRRFFSILWSTTVLLAAVSPAQTVKTVAGGFVGDGRPATKASFQWPYFVVQDQSGNTYVTDFSAHRIRKINSSGIISTYAGTGISGYNGDNIPSNTAMLSYPTGMTMDSAGNIVFADGGNNRVRRIDPSGIITTIAGNGNAGYSGDGGPAIDATFDQPWGVTYDAAGNLYISDIGNARIRIVDTSGIINTYAGNGTQGYGGDGGPATDASLNLPRGLTVDSHNNLYIADTANHRVRIVDAGGTINTFAGNGQQGFSGDGGPATQAKIGNPRNVVFRTGTVYITNAGSSRVRSVPVSTGIINTFAGSFWGYDGDNNPPLSTEFTSVAGLLFRASGVLFGDTFNARIRQLTGGVVKTFAGGFIGDGRPATSAALVLPESLAFDSAGNYYIADYDGNSIRKIDTTGKITTVAGTGVSGYTGDGGPAITATLYLPQGVAVDSSGNIFIADSGNLVIRKVDTNGTITTLVADPTFEDLTGLALDSSGNLISADEAACVVRKITPNGAVSVIAGIQDTCGYNGDNIPATTAWLLQPYQVALDSRGNLFIADAGNNRIRRVSPTQKISTVAGDGNCGFSGDGGPATSAEMCFPLGVAVTRGGTLYIADTINLRIRKVASGVINTYAGSGLSGFNGEGLPALNTNLDDPVAVAVNPVGVLHLLDDSQVRVRRVR